MLFFHQTVTRVRAPVVKDRYNNAERDWDNADRTRLVGLSVLPMAGTESGAGSDPRRAGGSGHREQTITGWKVQSPPGVDLDLRPTDRVELADYGDVLCEVIGEIARFPDPWGRGVHHVEATIERVDG